MKDLLHLITGTCLLLTLFIPMEAVRMYLVFHFHVCKLNVRNLKNYDIIYNLKNTTY